jgi:hypothetical protein
LLEGKLIDESFVLKGKNCWMIPAVTGASSDGLRGIDSRLVAAKDILESVEEVSFHSTDYEEDISQL